VYSTSSTENEAPHRGFMQESWLVTEIPLSQAFRLRARVALLRQQAIKDPDVGPAGLVHRD